MRDVENTAFYRNLEILKNIIAELANYLLVAAVSNVLLVNIMQDKADRKVFFWLAAVPLFCYFLREVCKTLPVFLVLHLLPLAAVIIIYRGSLAQKVFSVGIVTVVLILSLIKRFDKKEGQGMEVLMPPAAMGILIGLYIIDALQGIGSCGSFLLKITVWFTFAYFVFYFFKQFLHYMDMNNRTTDNIPMRRIFYPALGLSCGFSAVAAAVIAFISNRQLMDRVGQAIRNALLAALKFILSLFSVNQEPSSSVSPEEAAQEVIWEAAQEITEEAAVFKVLDILIAVVVFAVISTVLIMAVIGAIKLIKAAFARKRKRQLIGEEIFSDKVENLKPVADFKEKKGSSPWERLKESLSPEEKIRRIYRKTLLKKAASWDGEKKAAILKKGTARECCGQLYPQSEEDAQKLAALYEKARYGNGLCRQADVRRAKLLAGRLSQES